MPLRTYNSADVSIVFAGIPMSGRADGAFLSVERNEDSYSIQVGTDGEATRSKTNNKSGRITITLMQSSQANAALSAFHNAAEAGITDGIAPFLAKDNSGLPPSVYAAEKAWIVRHPTGEFDREAGPREWVLETDNLIIFHGSN